MILFFLAGFDNSFAQNTNRPNKVGPMGIEVNTYTGNMYFFRSDIYVPARKLDFDISFSYNSYAFSRSIGYGNGWSFNYSMKYNTDSSGNVTVTLPDGRDNIYILTGNSFVLPVGVFDSLFQYQPGKYLLKTKQGAQFYFDNSQHKRLTKITEPNGNLLNLSYNDSLVTGISNNAGQSIALSYSSGKLTTVTDANASPTQSYTYNYDPYGNLIKVTDPIGGSYTYSYLLNGPLSSVKDKNNNVVYIIYYEDYSARELVGCNSRISFSYDSTSRTTTITDFVPTSTNEVTTYTYNSTGWLTSMAGNCCGYNMSFMYDNNGDLIERKDANGNIYMFSYDNSGNVLTVRNPLNELTTLSYTDFSNIKTFIDAKGNTYSLNYDVRGNLTQLVQPNGATTSLVYATNGDMTSFTDPNGNIITLNYDTYGYLTQQVAPLSNVVNFLVNARGQVLSVTDSKGFVHTIQYDLLNRVIKNVNPAADSICMSYDHMNNLVTAKNENGQVSRFLYDASNRLIQIINAMGHSTNLYYDAIGNMTEITNAIGSSRTMAYDNLNRLMSITDAQGKTTSFDYDANGNQVSSHFPNGLAINYTYDRLDRIIKAEDESGTLGTVLYDGNGNLLTTTDGNGATVNYSYDNANRLVKIVDALGNFATASYDNNDNLISVTNRNNKTRSYVYDALNRKISYSDYNGFVITASYDQNDNISYLKDQNNNTTAYQYNNLDRMTSMIYPDGKVLQYGYDAIGNIINNILPDGSVINYAYDSLNRTVSKTLPGNNIFSYAYDPIDRLTAATNANGTVSFAYDALGRVLSESYNGKTTQYNYDISQRVSSVFYPNGTNIINSYNKRGLLTSIARNNATVASYQYDPAGMLSQTSFANGVVSNYQRDLAYNVTAIKTGNGDIEDMEIGYDKVMNKKSVNRKNNTSKSEQFTYDNGNRLVDYKKGIIGNTPAVENNYNFDAAGNRTSSAINGNNTSNTFNSLNQLTNSTGSSANISFTYDDNGNLTYDGVFYKRYDAEGRIICDSASLSNKISYKYDALGRRMQKTFNGNSVNYIYSGLSQIEQRNANIDTLINEVIFSDFDNPVIMTKNNSSYYYHLDPLNSVGVITNNAGLVAEHYEYDPWGKRTIYDAGNNLISSSMVGNRFGFTGQEQDTETNAIHFFYRQYSPDYGIFCQRDPMGYYDNTSLYQYVSDNPSSLNDPLGLEEGHGAKGHSTGDHGTGGHGAGHDPVDHAIHNAHIGHLAMDGLELTFDKGLQLTEALIDKMIQKVLSDKDQSTAYKIYSKLNKAYPKLLKFTHSYAALTKFLGKLLVRFDVFWKIKSYWFYKAKCPGSDADLITQTKMVKNTLLAPLASTPMGALLLLADHELGISDFYVTSTYRMNQMAQKYMGSNPIVALPNAIGTGLGTASIYVEGYLRQASNEFNNSLMQRASTPQLQNPLLFY